MIDNVISGNDEIGVLVRRTGAASAAGTEITGNYIGTDATGLRRDPQPQRCGVLGRGQHDPRRPRRCAQCHLRQSRRGRLLREQRRDVQSTGNVVRGNYIGINCAGTPRLANGYSGLVILNSSNNTIGGGLPGEGNVISGNGQEGIFVTAQTCRPTTTSLTGNLIGISANGGARFRNVQRRPRHRVCAGPIGGPSSAASVPADGNIIGGNASPGIVVGADLRHPHRQQSHRRAASTASPTWQWLARRVDEPAPTRPASVAACETSFPATAASVCRSSRCRRRTRQPSARNDMACRMRPAASVTGAGSTNFRMAASAIVGNVGLRASPSRTSTGTDAAPAAYGDVVSANTNTGIDAATSAHGFTEHRAANRQRHLCRRSDGTNQATRGHDRIPNQNGVDVSSRS